MMLLATTAPDMAMFVAAAVLAVFGALGVVLFRNPVHSALSLVMTLFGVAIAFIAQDAQFLAAVQVIVYAGAIVVMFLFVIMLLGVDRIDKAKRDGRIGQWPFVIVVSGATLGLVLALARWSWDAIGPVGQSVKISGPGANVAKLADSIFTTYLYPFEGTSALLVIAVVGAVFLSRRPGSEEAGESPALPEQPDYDEPSGPDAHANDTAGEAREAAEVKG